MCSEIDLEALRSSVDGDVVFGPDAASVAAGRAAERLAVRPRAVVRCASEADVAETLAFAVRHGLPVVARSGGHCFANRSSTSGLIIDVSPMSSVGLAGTLATVGTGARLGPVYRELGTAGVTLPAGNGSTVGIAGLTLGGGLGFLGRAYGLTSDRLRAARVVLGDGRVRDCGPDQEPELFWALRGAGGGHLAVVTALVLETVPTPITTAFCLRWTSRHAVDVIDAWQRLAPEAPGELGASLLLTTPPEIDRPVTVDLFGSMIGHASDTATVLGELVARAGVEPRDTQVRELEYLSARAFLAGLDHGAGPAGDGPEPGTPGESPTEQGFGTSEYFGRLISRPALQELVRNLIADREPGQSRELDFMPWGGAYNQVPVGATAFGHRTERFLLKQSVLVRCGADAGAVARGQAWLKRSRAAVAGYGTGGVYPNFPQPGLPDPGTAYHGRNHDRLLDAVRTYDPTGVFRAGSWLRP